MVMVSPCITEKKTKTIRLVNGKYKNYDGNSFWKNVRFTEYSRRAHLRYLEVESAKKIWRTKVQNLKKICLEYYKTWRMLYNAFEMHCSFSFRKRGFRKTERNERF